MRDQPIRETAVRDTPVQDQPIAGFYKEIELPRDFAVFIPPLFVMDDTPILSLEYHDVLELGFCQKGNGIFVVGHKIMPFSGGDISIISPGELHLAQSRRGTTSVWTFLFLDLEQLLLSHFPEMAGFDIHTYSGEDFRNIISPEEHGELTQIVSTMLNEAEYKKPRYKTMILTKLVAMAIGLERDFPNTSSHTANIASHRSIGRVKMALEFITQNYYEPIKINELAELCNMSSRNFARRFFEAMKRSAHEYIADTRIAMACGHLLRSDAPVSYVADQCGFFSISSFNRTFKEKTGMSPREWRKQHDTEGNTKGE
jgi:AraC-like DNA-binding protein